MKLNLNIFKSEFSRNIIALMTGTTIAQAIPIAISPILTRMYSPQDFGVFAIFLAINAITGVIAGAKYEEAIILPKNNKNALNLVVLSVLISFIFSFFLALFILLFNSQIVSMLGEPKIKYWLYFVPLTTFILAIYNSLNYYNIRNKTFKNISISQVSKSSSSAIVQVFIGLIQTGPFGLILGQIISYFTGNFILFKTLKEDINKKNIKKEITKKTIKSVAKEYSKFPKYSLPSIFINSLNLNIINFLISSIFSITTLGFYSITQRLIAIPAKVIGSSFSQVYFQKASIVFNSNGNTRLLFVKTLKQLIVTPIYIILFFIAEPLFAFVFGEKWRIAGLYAQILIPLAFVKFLSGSLETTLVIHQKQQYLLLINVLLILSTVVVFFFGYKYDIDFSTILKYYVILLSFDYGLILFLSWFFSKKI
jgi:O-antigen/teichoic acid export membrane protein